MIALPTSVGDYKNATEQVGEEEVHHDVMCEEV